MNSSEKSSIKQRIKELLLITDAVLVAHYYVDGDIQDLKGIVGTGRRPDIKKLQDVLVRTYTHASR